MNFIKLIAFGLLLNFLHAHASDTMIAQNTSNNILMAQSGFSLTSEEHLRERRRVDVSAQERALKNIQPSSQQKESRSTGLTVCPGEFALCASSICTPTGRTIQVKEDDGESTRTYKESSCKCPIITAEIAQQNGATLTALAAVNEGKMNGSCGRSAPDKIWALYSPTIYEYPQESTSPPFRTAMANRQICPAGSVGSNCWNFECSIDKDKTNGAKTATCFCAINEGQFGYRVAPRDTLVTAAGGYSNPSSEACNKYPANGWARPIGLIDSTKQ